MKRVLFPLLLFFSSCEIFEVTREPILAPPLGLEVLTVTSGAQNQVAVRFHGNNREVYFSGYRIYITTIRSDLEGTNGYLFAQEPPGGVILSNFKTPTDTNQSITYNGAMTTAQPVLYPHEARIAEDILQYSPLFSYSGGTFVNGTKYYVGVYAYSRADNKLSIPSIAEFSFP